MPVKHSTFLQNWLLLAACFVTGLAVGQSFPAAHGHINDLKGVLSPMAANDLEMRLRTFRDSNTVELAVVIMDLPDGEDHLGFTNRLARTWGIGSKEADNGALLAIYPNVRKARIEVGYGLEPVLTDAMCAIILAEKVVPNLKVSNYDAAVAGAVAEMMRLSSKEFRAQAPAPKEEDGGEGFMIAGMLLMFVGLPILFFIGARRNRRPNAKNNRDKFFNNKNDNDDGGGGYYSGPIILGGGSDSGSSWSSGGDSGGGSDFGGFSGGDFGGGGASSDW